jgi:superfamily II DNA/RNA helicase
MARGIDFDNVECVINYDVPSFITNYIHRVGRTARAGRNGKAYTIVAEQEVVVFICFKLGQSL